MFGSSISLLSIILVKLASVSLVCLTIETFLPYVLITKERWTNWSIPSKESNLFKVLGKDKCFNSNATFSEYDLIHVPSLLIFLVQNHHCFVMLHLVLVSVRSRRKIHLTSFSGSVTSESSHCPSADACVLQWAENVLILHPFLSRGGIWVCACVCVTVCHKMWQTDTEWSEALEKMGADS